MPTKVSVTIHESQWPENVRRDLIQSLRARKLNHKFLYDSMRQTRKWLELHRAYSPAQTDPDCHRVYDSSFRAAASACSHAPAIHLIGLGCGGGQKDVRLLNLLRPHNIPLSYTPCDVSSAMTLVAYEAALDAVRAERCHPVVCDLLRTDDLLDLLPNMEEQTAVRVITFFGMIPNFEPHVILPRLAKVVLDEDYLLFSANLAPGASYEIGVQKVLPLYDNDLTKDWLLSFLVDLGVESKAGNFRFIIEDCPAATGLKRIAVYFEFVSHLQISVGNETVDFRAGDTMRLFFSYRHSPESIRRLLQEHGLKVLDQWITNSEEEGVFLCRKDR